MKRAPISAAVFAAFVSFCGCSDEKVEAAAPTATSRLADEKVDSKKEEPPKTDVKISRKLLVLGIDGATWKLMDPLLAQGRLPNFKRLIDSGAYGPLKTFIPTASPLIWTTIATGVAPKKHGITDFLVKVPGTEEALLPTSNLRRAAAIWNILSERNVSVGVTGWWATYPAEEVKGFVISDQASTLRNEAYDMALELMRMTSAGEAPERVEQAEIYPPELGREIKELIDRSPEAGSDQLGRFLKLTPKKLAALQNKKTTDVEDILDIFKVALQIDRGFVAAGLHAIGKYMPDVAMLYLSGVDAAEHHFWKYIEPDKFKGVPKGEIESFGNVIGEYYAYVDEVLGRLLSLYEGREDELTIMVVSDHGHEANEAYDPAGKLHYNRVCSGEHERAPDGVIIVSGKDIAKGEIMGASVLDVAPTILALMGAPVGSDMPGRVLTEIIGPDFLASHPVTSVPTYSTNRAHTATPIRSPMSETLKKKLKGLGYIE